MITNDIGYFRTNLAIFERCVVHANNNQTSPANVSFWASGFRNTTDENLAKVTKVLGVSASYLRTGKEG